MLLAGDETGQTQNGNNNAYCQDNELSWINWELSAENKALLEFAHRLIALRKEQPVLKRRNFFQGRKIRGADVKDITWFEPAGKEMNDEAWNAGFVRCLGVLWAGDVIDEVDEKGEKIVGDTLLILLNAHFEPIPFQLPPAGPQPQWELLLDTADVSAEDRFMDSGQKYNLRERSLAVLRLLRPATEDAKS